MDEKEIPQGEINGESASDAWQNARRFWNGNIQRVWDEEAESKVRISLRGGL